MESTVDSFKGFLVDEVNGEKKRKKIADTILKVVKKKLISKDEVDGVSYIKFECDEGIKDTVFEVVIAIDYHKQFAKGMLRAVYVTISKETNSHRNTDYLTIDVDRVSDVDFMKTLDGLKTYFTRLVDRS